MNKEEVYTFLRESGVPFERVEHAAVYTMEDLAAVPLPHPDAEAKNLFVRDDKKKNYYLITVRGDKRPDLKAFRRLVGTRPLSFATPEELSLHLGLIPGAVTPLGVLNDRERCVTFFLDEELFAGDGIVGVHPNDNTATVYLSAKDLYRLIREHGNPAEIIKIPEFISDQGEKRPEKTL